MLQIDTAPVMLRHIELAFSDQYIGRSDMWRLQQSLRGTCVYSEKKILYVGLIKATVKRLFSKDGLVSIFVLHDSCNRLFHQHNLTSFLHVRRLRLGTSTHRQEQYSDQAQRSFSSSFKCRKRCGILTKMESSILKRL